MLPNFLIIGASKAGTTSLREHLREHPQVFMPRGEEIHYFPSEFNWDRGREWYESHFADAGDAIAVGEKSTTYTRHPHSQHVAERVHELLPDARLIYLIRHPIERVRSAYLYEVAHGREDAPVDVAVRTKPIYVDPSRYSMQLDEYLRFFRRERILVLTTEAFRADPRSTMRRVYEFLDVDPEWLAPSLEWEFNRTADKRRPRALVRMAQQVPGYGSLARLAPRPARDLKWRFGTRRIDTSQGDLPEEVRRELLEQLRPDLARLPQHLGEGFDCWGLL